MEELTVEILVDGGGRTSMADVEEICALGRKVGELQDKGKKIRRASRQRHRSHRRNRWFGA